MIDTSYLLEVISAQLEQPTTTRTADVDEIVMISEALRDQLPKRFVQVVYELEKGFNPGYPEDSHDKYERLMRIMKVSETLPNPQTVALGETSSPSPEPTFSLGKNDKERVTELCSQIRKIVFSSDVFDQPHKRLLLNRVAAIEFQIEQPHGKLDVLRAGVSEVGETLGKFGTDIEPLTKRIKEVFQIGRSNSDDYAQIPGPEEVKQLPSPEKDA